MPDSADSVKEYNSGKTLETNNNMVSVCYNAVNKNFSPPGTCVLSLTTLYMEDAWADVKEEDYVATKNRIARRMIDKFEKTLGVEITPYIEEIESGIRSLLLAAAT